MIPSQVVFQIVHQMPGKGKAENRNGLEWGMILHKDWSGRLASIFVSSSILELHVMIFALAGRRIDQPDTEPGRFPLRNVDLVRKRLRQLFELHPGGTLVSSAACGADLLALETAGKLGWRRRVILPFDRDRFRETSVTDRPGDWGTLYDQILDEVERAGGLAIESAPPGKDAYAFASDRILEEAERMAAGSGENEIAVAVWEGNARGPGDLTGAFAAAARARGMTVAHVSTLE